MAKRREFSILSSRFPTLPRVLRGRLEKAGFDVEIRTSPHQIRVRPWPEDYRAVRRIALRTLREFEAAEFFRKQFPEE